MAALKDTIGKRVAASLYCNGETGHSSTTLVPVDSTEPWCTLRRIEQWRGPRPKSRAGGSVRYQAVAAVCYRTDVARTPPQVAMPPGLGR